MAILPKIIILEEEVKIITFIKSRPFECTSFHILCDEGIAHQVFLLHEARWFSQGKALVQLIVCVAN